jgi:energy-coupling factor transport system ATP-binding protein
MILLRDVRYRYPSAKWVLQGIHLSIDAGEYVFVGGANGSGKSTLGYLFNGIIHHFLGGTLEGSVSVNETNTLELGVSELFNHVGLVMQNADAQLFNSTVEDEIAFGLESLGLPSGEIDKRVTEISKRLNLEDFLGRSPAALSGGEKRLVALASVLCLNPSVLLLDEPYGDLDWEATQRVQQTLAEINQSGKTVVVIEQRMNGFLQEATKCIVLDQGKLLFEGGPKGAREVLVREHLWPRYPRRSPDVPQSGDSVLAIHDLWYRVEEKEILKGVSLELRSGETVAIIGRNGSGKTTLIKHLNGLLRPTEGKVTFKGEEITNKAPSEVASHVGISFQNANDQFFKYRVKDEVLVGPRMLGNLQQDWIEEIWDIFDLRALLGRSPYRLSEGEKKRVALASILAMQPQLLVLDEPTSGQDGRFRETLALLLGELKDRGFAILMATHDLDFAQATANRWVILFEGKVAADGSPEDLLQDEQLIRMGAIGRIKDCWQQTA